MVKLLFDELALVACANMLFAEVPIRVCLFVRIEDIIRVKNLFGLLEYLKDFFTEDSRQPRPANHAVVMLASKRAAIF